MLSNSSIVEAHLHSVPSTSFYIPRSKITIQYCKPAKPKQLQSKPEKNYNIQLTNQAPLPNLYITWKPPGENPPINSPLTLILKPYLTKNQVNNKSHPNITSYHKPNGAGPVKKSPDSRIQAKRMTYSFGNSKTPEGDGAERSLTHSLAKAICQSQPITQNAWPCMGSIGASLASAHSS